MHLSSWDGPRRDSFSSGRSARARLGLILAAIEGGRPAVRELLGRALIWRVGIRWWIVALALPILPAVASLYLTATLDPGSARPVLAPWYQLMPTMLFQIVFAGVAEEFGWRGFALPRLQRRHAALTASLIVGAFHSLWHLPLFLLPGEGYATMAQEIGLVPAFLGYAGLVISLAVLFSWMFNCTRGSVLIAAAFHGSFNAWNNYLPITTGGTTALFRYVGLLAVMAAVVAIVFGPTNLGRGPRNVFGDGTAAPAD